MNVFRERDNDEHRSARRPSDVLFRRCTTGVANLECDSFVADEALRILVLDRNPKTAEIIEGALWVWPHRISVVTDIMRARAQFQRGSPTVMFVATDFEQGEIARVLRVLRKQFSDCPIVVTGPKSEISLASDKFRGADAAISYDELRRTSLYNVIVQLRQHRLPVAEKAGAETVNRLSLPWRESRMIGALTCDAAGTITDINRCLLEWLSYRAPAEVVGQHVWRNLLTSPESWQCWRAALGDLQVHISRPTVLLGSTGRRLHMHAEVFANPSLPLEIQVCLTRQTGRNGGQCLPVSGRNGIDRVSTA